MKAHNLSNVLYCRTLTDLVALLSRDVQSGSNYGNTASLSDMCELDNFRMMLLIEM